MLVLFASSFRFFYAARIGSGNTQSVHVLYIAETTSYTAEHEPICVHKRESNSRCEYNL